MPSRVKASLFFDGPFTLKCNSQKTFQIYNGYGRQIEASCFWDGIDSFEGSTTRLWQELANESFIILDVGANTGLYSLLAKTINPRASIFSFEPIKRIYQILETNISLNKEKWPGTPQILSFNLALSDYNGKGEMFDLPVEHMYAASLNKDIHAERGNPIKAIRQQVDVRRLDSFCADHGIIPDLIKIDVESHEPSVLRGMGEILRKNQPTLICEIWDNIVGAEVEKVLDGCGYRYFLIEDDIKDSSQIRNNEPVKGYLNYMFAADRIIESLKSKIKTH